MHQFFDCRRCRPGYGSAIYAIQRERSRGERQLNTASLYLVTVLIWGSSWLAIRYQIGIVAPEISLIYRFALATVLLVLWCATRGISLRFRLRDHPYLALLGLCLFSMNYLLFYHAAFNLATGLLAVIFSTMTVMNIVNSA
ncbi:MAG TPA: EamA family transporter, partial [Gammaproteobacteria bacterium]|nr:EamA family transporter [Gammaproteobacteria bacterium]